MSDGFDWSVVSPKFLFYRLYWWIMGGKSIFVPLKDTTLVVDDQHPLWYDVGAYRVEVTTDDPMWVYGPFLEEHVGKRNRDWHIILHLDLMPGYVNNVQTYVETRKVEIQFKRGKEKWATACAMLWA